MLISPFISEDVALSLLSHVTLVFAIGVCFIFSKTVSRAWFRSTDLWVMGPARFHCATLLIIRMDYDKIELESIMENFAQKFSK